jgi:hypothetical protein
MRMQWIKNIPLYMAAILAVDPTLSRVAEEAECGTLPQCVP